MKTSKLIDKVSDQFNTGEYAIAGVKVMDKGLAGSTILSVAAGATTGIVGLVAAQKATAGRDEGNTGGSMQALLVVTDNRVLMFGLNGLGRPKDLLSAMPREAVVTAELGTTQLMGQTMPELTLQLANDASVQLGVAKVHRKDAQAVIEAFG